MSRSKDFGAPSQDKPVDDLEFKLYGETFECRPRIQGKTLIDFVKAADGDDGGSAAEALMEFFRKVLTPESHERFVTLAEDEDKIIEVEDLGNIVSWLVEEYTQRPTQRSKAS